MIVNSQIHTLLTIYLHEVIVCAKSSILKRNTGNDPFLFSSREILNLAKYFTFACHEKGSVCTVTGLNSSKNPFLLKKINRLFNCRTKFNNVVVSPLSNQHLSIFLCIYIYINCDSSADVISI